MDEVVTRDRMNFTTILPVEVVQRIFSFLPPDDLGRVCQVSRMWRTLANSDNLWRQFCAARYIVPNFIKNEELETNPELEPLCYWGNIFCNYSNRISQNWANDNFQVVQEIPMSSNRVLSFGEYVLQVFDCFSIVDIYKMSGRQFYRVQKINLHLNINVRIYAHMQRHHLVLARNNVVNIYRKNAVTEDFDFETAVAVRDDKVIEPLSGEVATFTRNHLSDVRAIQPVAVNMTYVWLMDEEHSTVHIYNKIKRVCHRVLTFKHPINLISATRDYIYVCCLDGIFMFLFTGYREMHYTKLGFMHKLLCYNVSSVGFIEVGENNIANVINLRSLNIVNLEVLRPFRIILHPFECVAYVLGSSEMTVDLHAVNTRSGDRIWSSPIDYLAHCSIHNFSVRVIAGRFILVQPSTEGLDSFVLFGAKSGKVVTRGSLNNKRIVHCNDNFMILKFFNHANRQDAYEIRSYL